MTIEEKLLKITQIIRSTLKQKKIIGKEFALLLGKQPSEVSKLLSGSHNFTLKTLIEVEDALGIEIVNCHNTATTQKSNSMLNQFSYPGFIKGGKITVPATIKLSKRTLPQ